MRSARVNPLRQYRMDIDATLPVLRSVRTVTSLQHWSGTHLRNALPHEMSMFGLALRHALGFAVVSVVTVNLPAEFVRCISGPGGSLMCPILHNWFKFRSPQSFDAAESAATVAPQWKSKFCEFDLRKIVVHGHTSPCESVASFFGLYRVSSLEICMSQAMQLSAEIHEALLRTYRHTRAGAARSSLPTITDREREIVRWLAAGKTNWEVGRILGISDLTVKTHVQRLLDKTGTTSRAQLVAKVMSSEAHATVSV